MNWEDAARFCSALSRSPGPRPSYDEADWSCDWGAGSYRLPTEAEWEYACHAGTTTRWFFGDTTGSTGDFAWHGIGERGEEQGFETDMGNRQEVAPDIQVQAKPEAALPGEEPQHCPVRPAPPDDLLPALASGKGVRFPGSLPSRLAKRSLSDGL